MIPDKLLRLLGYNNLSVILEQERRHWLMKTDNNKQIQDQLTGDIFQGKVDNIGSDVILEAQKLPYKYDYTSEIKWGLSNADKILNVTNSAFPHSACVNGLLFARIISTNYPYAQDGQMQHNHYKIKFTNATECILPFGASPSSPEVYADRWIKTTTPPTLMILDNNTGKYSITRPLTFDAGVLNPVYYYPLSETLQPFDVTDLGYGEYELAAINDDGFIGYPLFWFTCDNSNIGSNLTFDANNINMRNEQIFFISNEGNASAYNAKIYTGIDGNNDATPDGTETLNYIIRCFCKSGDSFVGGIVDFSKSLDTSTIKLVNTSTQTEYTFAFMCSNNDSVRMSSDAPWEYNSSLAAYEIDMSYFDQNCIHGESLSTPLVSIFDVIFDPEVPFVKRSTDVGISGIRMGVSNISSDIYDKYPYNLNKWEGLPQWMNELEDGAMPEHLVMYAFHQPPTYDPDNPESMQGAGLILDPGKHKEDDSEDTTDNIGRVYILSNDDLEYKNNASTTYPKPARTAARMCDIPTSIAQLSGAMGISSSPIIDDRYVRTEASFNLEDKNRLYNTIGPRWVRPTALTANGNPVWSELGFPERFCFPGEQTLLAVDMKDHNDFRVVENLNPAVDPTMVALKSIDERGTGYAVADTGECVVGGFAFTYVVDTVGENGEVLTASILAPREPYESINLANFNLVDGRNITETYGTSPTSGTGRGLKISFVIPYDYFESILPKKGEYYNDLFAFVRLKDGLYEYQFEISEHSSATPKPGTWVKRTRISEFEVTSHRKSEGGIASNESYINSMIPNVVDAMPVTMKDDHVNISSIKVLQTSSFINVIDKTKTPVVPALRSEDADLDNVVDLCKWYCDGIFDRYNDGTSVVPLVAAGKNSEAIRAKLKELNLLRFDSYVVWRWIHPSDMYDYRFECGIVYRGFSNLFSTDTSTLLPTNKLTCDNFVHTNGNTTIVWDVPGIGVMMWVYDPTSTEKEDYFIDPETMDIHVLRSPMTYDKIDIRSVPDVETPKIVDNNNNFNFYVMTNNPDEVRATDTSVIYQQPEMTDLNLCQPSYPAGNEFLHGNWKLVFPRVSSYTLRDDYNHTKFIPKKMQIIKGRSISNVGAVYDEAGNDVSMKSLIVDEGTDKIRLRLFNSNTHTWEEV